VTATTLTFKLSISRVVRASASRVSERSVSSDASEALRVVLYERTSGWS
jgi:hypothetical protein